MTKHQDWDYYVPYLELVQCGEVVKPALFFKIGSADYADWSRAVVPQKIVWNWYLTKGDTPYVVVNLHILFENGNGTAIGIGGARRVSLTTAGSFVHSHRLRSRTLFDPANPAHRQAIEAWVAAPAPTMLFFVQEDFHSISYISMDASPEGKRIALEKLAEATEELKVEGVVPGGFREACAFIKDDLPSVSWWY